MNESIFAYFGLNEQFRKIVEPLCLFIPKVPAFSVKSSTINTSARGLVQSTARQLSQQLAWMEPTRTCLVNLRLLWKRKYAHLVLIDTRYTKHDMIPIKQFILQARASPEVT